MTFYALEIICTRSVETLKTLFLGGHKTGCKIKLLNREKEHLQHFLLLLMVVQYYLFKVEDALSAIYENVVNGIPDKLTNIYIFIKGKERQIYII